jgi:hypothetical protein
MDKPEITIVYLSRLTGVSSKTIAWYAKLLRPLALQLEEETKY